jgi:Mn-dependent DtxR family transcriptional regulator
VYLLYSNHDSIRRLSRTQFIVQTNALATELQIRGDRLRRYVQRLQEMDLLLSVEYQHGSMLIRLREPNEPR